LIAPKGSPTGNDSPLARPGSRLGLHPVVYIYRCAGESDKVRERQRERDRERHTEAVQ
jgi:hypothetical protein